MDRKLQYAEINNSRINTRAYRRDQHSRQGASFSSDAADLPNFVLKLTNVECSQRLVGGSTDTLNTILSGKRGKLLRHGITGELYYFPYFLFFPFFLYSGPTFSFFSCTADP